MVRTLLASLALALLAGWAKADPPPPAPVRIDSGQLQGVQDGDVIAYKGVPYAAPPVGPLRWRPPQPVTPWMGVRDAATFGAICPQTPGFATPANAVQSEDCLFLNVWAPATATQDASGLPVMVWIHGGGDDSGAADQPQFDGTPFAKDGVIFVSVDYRLGALGWFAHPALTKEAAGGPTANYGLMDEIAALKWVQRNIRAFGGNPTHVTVAGESAGGEAVLFLMSMPAAKGLFSRAIVESGTGWATYPDLKKAEGWGVGLAARAGAPTNADAATLRALPVDALLKGQGEGVSATIDGVLVKASPAQAFLAGADDKIPLLIGSNNGEDSLLGDSDPKDELKDIKPADLAALRAAYGAETPDDDALGHAIFRDQWMGAPAHWIAVKHGARAPSYLYQFAYIPQVLIGRRKVAAHGFEMLFAFKALSRAPRPLIALPTDITEMQLVHDCWVSFAKTGAPACAGAPAWPWISAEHDQLMLFGQTQTSLADHFRQAPYSVLDRMEVEGLKPAGAR